MIENNYRGRDDMTLKAFIADVEECHFRSQYDTGANPNAMFVWNILRKYAGLDALTRNDLIRRYAESEGISYEEMKERDSEYAEYERSERSKLPVANNGCECHCHTSKGVMHMSKCC